MPKIQALCLLTGLGDITPAGFATVIEGSYELDRNAVSEEGVNDQILTEGGLTTCKLELSKCVGMLKAELLKFQRPATGIAMPALGTYLLITEEGEAYKLSNGAGSSLKIDIPSDAQGLVGISCTMEFGKVEDGSAIITPVNLTSPGHQKRHCAVTIDTVAATVNSMGIDTGLSIVPSADCSEVRSALAGYDYDEYKPTASCEISTAIDTAADFLGVLAAHDIVLVMNNGTVGENVTFTFTDYTYTKRAGALQRKGERFKKYDFIPATQANGTLLVIS